MVAAQAIYRDDRRLQWFLLAFMALYYGCILSDIGLGPPAIPLNLTFNSMLAHLLHGEFFVDPATVGDEGFLRNGHVYAYWGIWCALLRLPLWLTHRLGVDITTWSCLAAVCLAGTAKIRTLLFLRSQTPNSPSADKLYKLMLLYILFGGSEIAFLKASIFQEIVFWAAAFGAVFVYFAIIGLVLQNFSRRTLSGMAVSAGLALLTRVSTGIGLCVAYLLLLLVLAFTRPASNRTRFLLPLALFAALIACAGIVNYFRWGNPATFADHTLYLMNRHFPDRMPRTHQYGYFNLARIPFGLLYYFLPLWVFPAGGGSLLFEATQTRLMDAVELPPSSFFLTDLLPILFLAVLFLALLRKHAQQLLAPLQCLALASGLVIPCLLMLTAISMNYRYRMEFYPLIDLLAFLGLYLSVINPTYALRAQRHLRWFQLATAISILAAFVEMVLYKLSVFGPAQQLLRQGLVHYYLMESTSIEAEWRSGLCYMSFARRVRSRETCRWPCSSPAATRHSPSQPSSPTSSVRSQASPSTSTTTTPRTTPATEPPRPAHSSPLNPTRAKDTFSAACSPTSRPTSTCSSMETAPTTPAAHPE